MRSSRPLERAEWDEVYRARDLTLKREVAIKVLPAYWAREPDRLRRFELEAQSTAALNHPNRRGLALRCGCSTDTRSKSPEALDSEVQRWRAGR